MFRDGESPEPEIGHEGDIPAVPFDRLEQAKRLARRSVDADRESRDPADWLAFGSHVPPRPNPA